MLARKKVVAPVTPRIIQAHPRHRFFRYLLLVCAFFLTIWFSYDYGRKQPAQDIETPTASSGNTEKAVLALTQERDTLRQQVAELQQSLQQAQRDLKAAQARIGAPQQATSSPQPASTVEPAYEPPVEAEPPPVTATVTEAVDNTLRLENLHIEPTASENVYRIGFSVLRDGDGSDRVTGTIWIAVNGYADGEPRRLSFKRLSPDRRSYVKMGFDLQQDVSEDVVLPDNFSPKNILIEAKPYGDLYTGTSVKFDWYTAG